MAQIRTAPPISSEGPSPPSRLGPSPSMDRCSGLVLCLSLQTGLAACLVSLHCGDLGGVSGYSL